MWLFLFLGKGTAQDYRLLSEEEKWKIRLHSYVLVHIDHLSQIDLPVFHEIKSPLALYIPEYESGHEPLLRSLGTVVDSILVLGDFDVKPDLFQDNWSVQVNISDVDVLELDQFRIWKDSSGINIGNELLRIRTTSPELLTDSVLVDIWKLSGKVPNFVESIPGYISFTDSIVQTLNGYKRIFGSTKSKEGLLYGVSFENQKNLLVNGHFSYPEGRISPLPILIPHKAGYYFSPDIIRTTAENRGNLKEFIGFPLDFEYGLTDHFVFGPSISNLVRKNNRELIVKDVLIRDDTVHGKVGYLDKGTFVDAGLNSRAALQGSFTITAWVKPTALNRNNSILGKGANFVLKLHNGLLTFTMADVKDYISEASPVPLDQWTHTALVHSKLTGELGFYINGVQTDRVKLIEDYDTSDHNIMIGSNIWEEFFMGYLTDIKIWERELNPIEIARDYQILAVKEGERSGVM
ncbi:MAG TPA: LamG domain-containing protein, partial [Arenibacter sp.]|nr:LamG domain-containing protein [Arenibacter sp.]